MLIECTCWPFWPWELGLRASSAGAESWPSALALPLLTPYLAMASAKFCTTWEKTALTSSIDDSKWGARVVRRSQGAIGRRQGPKFERSEEDCDCEIGQSHLTHYLGSLCLFYMSHDSALCFPLRAVARVCKTAKEFTQSLRLFAIISSARGKSASGRRASGANGKFTQSPSGRAKMAHSAFCWSTCSQV